MDYFYSIPGWLTIGPLDPCQDHCSFRGPGSLFLGNTRKAQRAPVTPRLKPYFSHTICASANCWMSCGIAMDQITLVILICIIHSVRSFSFPGSTPVCGGFFPGRTWVIICTRSSQKKTSSHTGVDPGKLNERTQYFAMYLLPWCLTLLFWSPARPQCT